MWQPLVRPVLRALARMARSQKFAAGLISLMTRAWAEARAQKRQTQTAIRRGVGVVGRCLQKSSLRPDMELLT